MVMQNEKVKDSSKQLGWLTRSGSAKLIQDLANIAESDVAWFRKRWEKKLDIGDDAEVLRLQRQLRELWVSSDEVSKERTLEYWLRPAGSGLDRLRRNWIVSLRFGLILPDPRNFGAALVYATLWHNKYLRECENPGCRSPFFIAMRNDQKFCTQGACTQYKQRKWALENWNRKGAVRRRQKREQQN